MDVADLTDLGWDAFFEQQAAAHSADAVPARVLEVHRSGWHVAAPGVDALVPPREGVAATVGDWLLLERDSLRPRLCLERKSLFKRRAPGTDRHAQLIAANVDTLFLVSSCNQDFNVARLERYLAIGREAGVAILIVLTKADLAEAPDEYTHAAARLTPGVHAEAVNALSLHSVSCLDPWLAAGQTIALLGSSGVGKSTLTNTLLGDEHIATRTIREDDAKGRHTTTARQLHRLPGGAWLLDTPGMRELQLTDVGAGLDDVFSEITALATTCRFTDCTHDNEPGCAVCEAIEAGRVDAHRLKRWRKLVREEAHNRESLAERRARDKSTGKLYKRIIDDNRHRKGRT